MKKIYLFLTLIVFYQQAQTQIIKISDSKFRNALLYTLCADTNGDGNFDSDADTNNDNEIQVSEAKAIFGLDVGLFNINSLEGIEFFTNLETLYCDYNNLTSLDISKNTKLKFLECTLNQLTSLDVSNNLDLEKLYCPSNNLTRLDVSNNSNLNFLECAYNKITTLDVSKNPNLTAVICFKNELNSLNLNNGNNTILETVSTKFNSDLTCIKVDDEYLSNNKSGWLKDTNASYSVDCGVLDVDEFDNEIQVTIYPNPVSNLLKIRRTNAIKINTIKVLDTQGKLIFKEDNNFNQIDLSNLNQGLYIIIFETDNSTFSRKIIKN